MVKEVGKTSPLYCILHNMASYYFRGRYAGMLLGYLYYR